jgi:hypothetical protein
MDALSIHHGHIRLLVSEHNFFVPLTCNNPACNVKRSTWTTENYKFTDRTVTIPCGHCITFDYQSSTSSGANTLVLPYGLDVQGTLKFVEYGYKNRPLTIITPWLRVQGKLIFEGFTDSVGAEPFVKIILTDGTSGGLSVPTTFLPSGNNAFACSATRSGTPTPCVVGAKSIVVAGGQLDVRGLPSGCMTWVKLHDVPRITKLPNPAKFTRALPTHPNIFCRTASASQTFTAGSPYINEWSAFLTGKITVAGSLLSTGRQFGGKDGVAWDIGRLRGCLLPNQQYLFSCRVKFHSNVPTGTASTCAKSGENCFRLTSIVRFASGSVTDNKGSERRSDSFAFGEWNTFHASFTFGADELAANPMSHDLVLVGPAASVGIEIDDVSLGLLSPNLVPNPTDVCKGNLIMNGDAAASKVDPYPMDIAGNGRISVGTDLFQTVVFFRTEKRTSSSDSVAQYLDAPECIVPGGRYNARAKVRVISSSKAIGSRMTLLVFYLDGSTSRIVVAECSPSANVWVDCSATFSVDFSYDAKRVERVRVQFETNDASVATMDVANWRLEFVDVTQSEIIVQSNGVQGCWGNGAEILITSATTDFESAQRRRLVGAPIPYANGLVRLRLDGFVPPSVTILDGDGFAVEVALLSRNIVFEGARDRLDPLLGGHLMIMNTPGVVQYIEGVEFRNFGRQGKFRTPYRISVQRLTSHAPSLRPVIRRNRKVSDSLSLVS